MLVEEIGKISRDDILEFFKENIAKDGDKRRKVACYVMPKKDDEKEFESNAEKIDNYLEFRNLKKRFTKVEQYNTYDSMKKDSGVNPNQSNEE